MARQFTATMRDLRTHGAPGSRRSLALTWGDDPVAIGKKLFPGCPKKHRENFVCGPADQRTND
jgi:hypothetical protein